MSHGNWKAMFKAVQDNDIALVEYYIRQGIDINFQHPEFMTSPLIESIRCNHLAIMHLLLANGAHPDANEYFSDKSPGAIAHELENNKAIELLNQYLEPSKQWAAVTRKDTMKAVVCTTYGSPEVLEIHTVEKPVPKDHEILVQIVSTAVNSGDVRVRALAVDGFLKIVMRFVLGFSKPRKPVLGTVFAGIIESVGAKVSAFSVGDRVFGMTGFAFGTYAEYLTINQDSHVIAMPQQATFDEAAALIFGGQTAIYFMDKARITDRSQPKILIIGATGAVGTAAIQIAGYYGAEITAVCSSEGKSLVEHLGVSDIILYDQEDFTQQRQSFDFIFDCVGKTTRKQCQKLLKKGGIYKTVGGLEVASESKEQLALIKKLYENGYLKAVIDKTFSLDNIAEAHRYVDTGRKKGNVIVRITTTHSLSDSR